MKQYNFYRNKSTHIRDFISKSPLLSAHFDEPYFSHIAAQVDFMEEKGWNGPINSFFLFFMDDSDNGFGQTKRLEKYLKLIIEHSTTTNADRSHIKGQIKTDNSVDTLFEISILGNLLNQLPPGDIELFPTTVGKKDVEARIKLDSRWIYLDATTLNDSEGETKELTDLLNKGGGVGKGMWVDFQRDTDRFIKKMEYKSPQFMPNTPNVLVISIFGTRPLFIHDEWSAKSATIVPNISLLMEFDRKDLKTTTTENCDDSCPLSDVEVMRLKELFSGSDYVPLVFGL